MYNRSVYRLASSSVIEETGGILDLNQVSVFIKVIQSGSFTAAARDLGMPVSTVSAKVSLLERDLGSSLIQRTTRRLQITEVGQIFYDQCLLGLESLQFARDQIAQHQKVPLGTLKITAPLDLGQELLPPAIAQYKRQFPQVEIQVTLTDRRVDLLSEGYDLALRAGNLKDSTLKVRKLGETYFGVYSSKGYLKENPLPEKPQDLRQHQAILFSPFGGAVWDLRKGASHSQIKMRGGIQVDNLKSVRDLVSLGAGVALLPNFYCLKSEGVKSELVRLLPEWVSMVHAVQFVYPAQKFLTPKVQEFLKIAEPPIKSVLASI